MLKYAVLSQLVYSLPFWFTRTPTKVLYFPQVQIHSHAQRAAEAAEAAAMQGQFWQMHDTLFIHQQQLGNGYLVEYGNNLELDICQFLQDMCKHVHLDRINKDIESGLHSGVTVAPALFIHGIGYRFFFIQMLPDLI